LQECQDGDDDRQRYHDPDGEQEQQHRGTEDRADPACLPRATQPRGPPEYAPADNGAEHAGKGRVEHERQDDGDDKDRGERPEERADRVIDLL
jgi:hypothetical protein